ncbi:hypothetical protein [Roseinatronobacter sp. S2]|uniref:hypothetical protein n=1 Tax=Roseinatronobacter sp. S2 TaxID=3035471 RepID=UPI0024107676|nr:hypothetical protein [Roseinatronobacter sp. S2]WFE75907.1 hypothetical protein P8S53_05780 [Roseinatronobacter sp. S2]
MKTQPNTPAAAAIELANKIAWIQTLPDLSCDVEDDLQSGWAYAWPGEDDDDDMTELESGWADDFGDDEQGGA